MQIAVIGLNHITAPIDIREQVSFTDSQKIEVLNEILDFPIREAVVLSTCNRSEVYIYGQQIEEKIELVKNIYCNFCHNQGIREFLFEQVGIEAARHLYYVAAGLDSIVVGEDQILGQVREAHEFAMAIGASGKILNKLFREAITTAKHIKTTTKISEYPLSISYIGVKYLKEQMRSLVGKKVLLIGAGKMNKLTLNHLYEEQVGKIYMTNRTSEKVKELMALHPDLLPVEYERRYEILGEVDIVITCTAAPHMVLKQEQMPHIQKELHILDIALPRDVEEAIANHPMIHLYDIDNLKEIAHRNTTKRNELALAARETVEENLDELMSWLHMSKIDPTIKSLNERCEEIEIDTMNYLKRKIELSCREEKLIEKMLKSSLKRLIREPISALKEIKDQDKQQEYIKVVEELFDL